MNKIRVILFLAVGISPILVSAALISAANNGPQRFFEDAGCTLLSSLVNDLNEFFSSGQSFAYTTDNGAAWRLNSITYMSAGGEVELKADSFSNNIYKCMSTDAGDLRRTFAFGSGNFAIGIS